MKKSIIFSLIIPLFCLSSCVLYNGKNKDGSPKDSSSSSSSQPTTQTTNTSSEEPTSTSTSTLPPAPQGKVNLYLVLGPNGILDKKSGEDFPAKFLENTVTGTFDIGSALPGDDRVESTIVGAYFSHWVNRDTTEILTTVPAEDSVLVAVFDNGKGGNDPVPDPLLPASGYGFMFQETTAEGKPYFKVANPVGEWKDGSGDVYQQYKFDDFTLVENQHFRLYDFESKAGWTVVLDPWSLDSDPDKGIDKRDEYIKIVNGYYVVQQTFNAKDIYLKLRYGMDKLYLAIDHTENA